LGAISLVAFTIITYGVNMEFHKDWGSQDYLSLKETGNNNMSKLFNDQRLNEILEDNKFAIQSIEDKLKAFAADLDLLEELLAKLPLNELEITLLEIKDPWEHHQLIWGRLTGKQRRMHLKITSTANEAFMRPLQECPVELRLKVYPCFSRFLEEALESAKTITDTY
jgi:hypothetical protein